MDVLLGYSRKGEGLVYKLHKSIYGLRQASRQWLFKFSLVLIANGFTQSKSDYSLFTYGFGANLVILLLYVEDIILASLSSTKLSHVQQLLQSLCKLKVLGDLKFFLGLEIARSPQGICLSQRKYTLSILEDTGFLDCQPATLPVEPNVHLNAAGGELLSDSSVYCKLIGD